MQNNKGLFNALKWIGKYNKKCLELEHLKEVMSSDVYKRVTKELISPMQLRKYKLENERLRSKVKLYRDEIEELREEIKCLKSRI